MSLEAAEREYFKYLQNKVQALTESKRARSSNLKASKQAAAAEAVAAAAMVAAAVAPPVTDEIVSKRRGRKPKNIIAESIIP